MANRTPVHQVFRVVDGVPWQKVERRLLVVEVVAHAQNVGIRRIVVNDGIGVRSVAIVASKRGGDNAEYQ